MDSADNAIERGVSDRRISAAADPEIMALLGAEREWSTTSPQLPSDSGNFTLAPPSATRV